MGIEKEREGGEGTGRKGGEGKEREGGEGTGMKGGEGKGREVFGIEKERKCEQVSSVKRVWNQDPRSLLSLSPAR